MNRHLQMPDIKSLKTFQKQKRNYKNVFLIFGWIFSLIVWIFIFLIILSYKYDLDERNYFLVFGIIAYIIYIIIEFFSPIFKLLCSKSNKGIYEEMKTFFKGKPFIYFYCECSHEEKRRRKENEYYERVVTYTEKKEFKYFSCRDASGTFILNVDKKKYKKKHYLILELIIEIDLSDDNTYFDFKDDKQSFIQRNRFRDKEFYCEEKVEVVGCNYYNFIKLHDSEPFFCHIIWGIIFILITFGEFYKLYINYISIDKTFTIKKFISTRNDLSINDNYNHLNPKLKILDKEYTYSPNIYNYVCKRQKRSINLYENINISSQKNIFENNNQLNLNKNN